MKIKKIMMCLVSLLVVLFIGSINTQAANGIEIVESDVKVPYCGTKTVDITYTGNFYDLAVIASDGTKITTSLSDLGNGKARLTLASIDFGKTLVAVYKYSNSQAVDYITVSSGLTNGDEVKNYYVQDGIVTVYSDTVIRYGYVLNGDNGATAAINGITYNKKASMNELMITANVLTDDNILPGLATFTAEYYDMSNKLIKAQKVYARSNLGVTNYMYWYIPKECVTIILK